MLLNYNKWKSLNEQSKGLVALTLNPAGRPAIQFIQATFKLGKHSTSGKANLDDLKRAKAELTKYTMNQLSDMAIKAGVTKEAILALQTDLDRMSGGGTVFKIANRTFVDGRLGTNTVDAYLDYQISLATRYSPTTAKPTSTKPVDHIPGVKDVYRRK